MPENFGEYYLGVQVLLEYLGNWSFITDLCEKMFKQQSIDMEPYFPPHYMNSLK